MKIKISKIYIKIVKWCIYVIICIWGVVILFGNVYDEDLYIL